MTEQEFRKQLKEAAEKIAGEDKEVVALATLQTLIELFSELGGNGSHGEGDPFTLKLCAMLECVQTAIGAGDECLTGMLDGIIFYLGARGCFGDGREFHLD